MAEQQDNEIPNQPGAQVERYTAAQRDEAVEFLHAIFSDCDINEKNIRWAAYQLESGTDAMICRWTYDGEPTGEYDYVVTYSHPAGNGVGPLYTGFVLSGDDAGPYAADRYLYRVPAIETLQDEMSQIRDGAVAVALINEWLRQCQRLAQTSACDPDIYTASRLDMRELLDILPDIANQEMEHRSQNQNPETDE